MTTPLVGQINAIPDAGARMRAAIAARSQGALPPNSLILHDGSIIDGTPQVADEETLVKVAQATQSNVLASPFHNLRFGTLSGVVGRGLGIGKIVANVHVDGDPEDVLIQCSVAVPGLTVGDRVMLAFDPPHAFYVVGILDGGRQPVNFSLGQEGEASIPVDEPALFCLGSDPALGGLDVIEACVACAVGPDGSDETWRVYDVDTDDTVIGFTVTDNGAAAFGTGTIVSGWSLKAPGRYAVEALVVGSGSPSIGLSVTVAASYNQIIST